LTLDDPEAALKLSAYMIRTVEGSEDQSSDRVRLVVRITQWRCSQDIADSSDKGQMLTIVEMEVPLFRFTALDSDADRTESASFMLTISMMPRSTSWK
jgi:hypothetical protein